MKSNVVFKNIAFTGPSGLVPEAMRLALYSYVSNMPPGSVVLSGGAHGVDSYVAAAAVANDLDLRLVVPGDKPWNRDLERDLLNSGYPFDKITVPGEYRARNEKLVELCDLLVPCLLGELGKFYRSGEWMTKNIALNKGRPVFDLEWRSYES